MTEFSKNPIVDTTYDDVITHDGYLDNRSTYGRSSSLELLDLSALSWGVQLSLRIHSDIDAEMSASYTSATHGFDNVDDILLGEGADTVTVERTASFGLDSHQRVPVIDAGTGSNQDLLIIQDGAISGVHDYHELNMETGMLTGMDDFWGQDSFGRFLNFNWLTYLEEEDITIIGTTGDDVIWLATVESSLFPEDTRGVVNAGDGWDIVVSGFGDDTINGGNGYDQVSYIDATGAVTVYLEYTGRDVGGGRGADHLTSVEDLVGSRFSDRLVGDDQGNYFWGGNGWDFLKGQGGNDWLHGQDGSDRLLGGEGADMLDGGEDDDVLLGGVGADLLYGQGGDDYLYGGRDNDMLYGGEGNDRLKGNRNDDALYGGAGEDTLFGGGNNDTLYGEDGVDRLLGENGNDRLDGGLGDDVLSGGAGADVFVYSLTGLDRVKDFEDGIDQLDLSGIAGFTTFADVTAVAQDKWGGVVLDFGNDDILFVENMDFADFDASDVIL